MPALEKQPSKLAAAAMAVALSLLFVAVYTTTNWLASQRHDVGTWYYAWEHYLPFLPLLIIPYMSIDGFFVVAPFLCRTSREMWTLAQRLALAILVAGIFFLVLPLQLGVPRPQPTGWAGEIFRFLHGFDRPYNLFPSLHIALRTILAAHYSRHTRGAAHLAIQFWFFLIGLSTLCTGQHHFVDVVGGFVLGLLCIYLLREESTHLPVEPNRTVGTYYAIGALVTVAIAGIGWPWTALLLWPAGSFAIVAAAYFGVGPGIYRKNGGVIPFSARLLMGPVLVGQYLSLLHYRRQCAPWHAVTPRVWIGAKLTPEAAAQATAQGVTAVLDLTAEFSETEALLGRAYLNLGVLDLTALNTAQMRTATDFITRESARGVVYVHCKAGYSRSAIAVGAYLLERGLAASADEVCRKLRAVRPSIIIRPEARAALEKYARRF